MTTNEQKQMTFTRLTEEQSTGILETQFPSYSEFVRLTKSNMYLTNIDKHTMLCVYIVMNYPNDQSIIYNSGDKDMIDNFDKYIDRIFYLYCEMYNLRSILNRKKKLEKRKFIIKQFKSIGIKIDINMNLNSILNEDFISEESKFLNWLPKSLGYEIPTTEELIEYKNNNPELSEEELEKLNRQINR